MANNQQTWTLSLRSVLEKDKLSGMNFLDWYRNLRIVLKQEKVVYSRAVNSRSTIRWCYISRKEGASEDPWWFCWCDLPHALHHELWASEVTWEHGGVWYDHTFRAALPRASKAWAVRSFKVPVQVCSARGKPSGTWRTLYDRLHRESRQVEFPISQELATDLIMQSLLDNYS